MTYLKPFSQTLTLDPLGHISLCIKNCLVPILVHHGLHSPLSPFQDKNTLSQSKNFVDNEAKKHWKEN